MPTVLFNTALALEKKQAGKAKEIYAKIAKDSTFWGEQAHLRLELLSKKEVKEHIAKGILGTWRLHINKKPWSEKLYNFETEKTLKIYTNGIAEWFENGISKKKTTYKLYDGELPKKTQENIEFDMDIVINMKDPEFQCLILFEQGGLQILRKKYNAISLAYVSCCGEIFYRRVE